MTNDNTSESAFVEQLTADLSSQELIFPTSLNATMKIRQALNDPDISNDHVARIISVEPVLCAQILLLSNSAMFNTTGKRIVDIRAATMLLGFGVVRNLAISVGMKQLQAQHAGGPPMPRMDGLWTRSVRMAALACVLAKQTSKLNASSAMIAGLLHDVGKFYILSRARHYQYQQVSDQTLWNLVEQLHEGMRIAILENWNIASDIRAAVMDYQLPDFPFTGKPSLIDILAAADFLDGHFVAQSIDSIDWENIPTSFKNLQLDAEKTASIMNETQQELSLIMHLLT